MEREVRCTNPSCGHPSRFAEDELGRLFRCVRCGTRLPAPGRARPTLGRAADRRRASGPAAAGISTAGFDDAPWERETAAVGRSLGVALPKRLGRYRGLSSLEPTAQAWVYRAPDPDGPGEVTVVVPTAAALAAAGPGGREAYLERARALARLRHPGLVPVLEVGMEGPTLFVAMAPAEGPTLADALARQGRLDPVRAAEIAADVAEALASAHARGVVHGDVTPSRIRLDERRRALLADFRLEPGVGVLETPATPSYTAPERLGPGAGAFEPASDQYSLGAVLYHMLSGHAPYEGPDATVFEELRTEDPIPLGVWRPGLSRTLVRICRRATARDPRERFAGCAELAEALRRWSRRARTRAEAVDTVRGATRWVRRRPAAAAATALALVGLVATTTFVASALIASTSISPLPNLSSPTVAARGPDLTPAAVRP